MIRAPKETHTFDTLLRDIPGVRAPRYAEAYDAMKRLALSCSACLKKSSNSLGMQNTAWIHLSGESGLGKTALMGAFCNHLKESGFGESFCFSVEKTVIWLAR